MERWQQVFRKGIAPQLSTTGLEALRDALVRDDPALVQGVIYDYNPDSNTVIGACAIGYCGWQDEGINSGVGVTRYFDDVCNKTVEVGIDAGPFVKWFDETPRAEMRPALLAEVDAVLRERGVQVGEAV